MALIPTSKLPDFKGKAVIDGVIKDYDSANLKGKYFVIVWFVRK
jgi:hypothetical protein